MALQKWSMRQTIFAKEDTAIALIEHDSAYDESAYVEQDNSNEVIMSVSESAPAADEATVTASTEAELSAIIAQFDRETEQISQEIIEVMISEMDRFATTPRSSQGGVPVEYVDEMPHIRSRSMLRRYAHA